MLQFPDIRRVYNWDGKTLARKFGRTSYYESERLIKGTDEYANDPIYIKHIEGIVLRNDTAAELMDNLVDYVSPLISNIKGQTELIVALQTFGFKVSDWKGKISEDHTVLDIVAVVERFGASLQDAIEGGDPSLRKEEIVEQFAIFLIRLIRMTEQRDLVAPNITPANILYDEKYIAPYDKDTTPFPTFKMADSTLRNSLESLPDQGADLTYALPELRRSANQSDVTREHEVWRKNAKYSAGISLLQIVTGLNRRALEQLRREDDANGANGKKLINKLNSTLGNFVNISGRLKAAVSLLLQCADIDQVARAFEDYPGSLSEEDFKPDRDLALEDQLVEMVRQRFESPIQEIMIKLLRRCSYSEVEEDLKKLPKIEWKCVENTWPLAELKGDQVEEIAAKAAGVPVQNQRVAITVNGKEYRGDVNAALKRLGEAFAKHNFVTGFHLDLERSTLNDEGAKNFASIFENPKSVITFFLNVGATSITDAGVTDISQAIRKLELIEDLTLIFSEIKGLTDESVNQIVDALNALWFAKTVNLNLAWCQGITDAAATKLVSLLKSRNNINKLTLNLSATGLTEAGLTELAKTIATLPQIERLSLDLSTLKGLTEAAGIALIDAITSLPALSNLTLNLAENAGITDKVGERIAALLHNNEDIADVQINIRGSGIGEGARESIKGAKNARQFATFTVDA
eukprot:TRINITY_DN1338_c0_g1_i1.p1 TRINITY_DN1338_c0_g1~~TRINITY_DN1338_c0_g1_i1.p1  ORF type:complete len:690 (+),score=219.51 TRINITY_DN1338_c0_g1_i1:72-2141(+)